MIRDLKNYRIKIVLHAFILITFAIKGADTQPGALNRGGEFRPYRPGIVLIGGIKSALAVLDHEIESMESEVVGVSTLKQELAAAKRQLAQVKNSLGITPLELQQNALKQQFDGFAQRFFKDSQLGETFLYYSLNEKITNIINDPVIKRKLHEILHLKLEIGERLGNALKEIKDIGRQINIMTRDDQRGLNTIRTQLTFLEQQIAAKTLSDQAQALIAPIQQRINAIQTEIDELLARRQSDTRINLIQQYKNRMKQYELLLDYLRDPAAIPLATEEKILAID